MERDERPLKGNGRNMSLLVGPVGVCLEAAVVGDKWWWWFCSANFFII